MTYNGDAVLPLEKGQAGENFAQVNIPNQDGDQWLRARLNGMIVEATTAKKSLEDEWRKYRRYYEADQWKKNRATWRANNVINVIFSVIETVHPLLTDDLPMLSAKPREEENYPQAEMLSAAFEFLHEKLNIYTTVSASLWDALLYGSGILKVTWDADDEPRAFKDKESGKFYDLASGGLSDEPVVQPIGEVCVERISPFFLYPDPAGTSFDDCAYVVEAKPVDMSYIRKRWPQFADRISPDDVGLPSLTGTWDNKPLVVDFTKVAGSNYQLTHDPRYLGIDGQGQDEGNKRTRVMLYEVWVNDVGLLTNATSSDFGELQSKYPNGRIITMAGGIILDDKANPFGGEKFPYVKFDDYTLNDVFWGMGECKQLMTLQKEINKRSCQLIENAELIANPKTLIPDGSGIDIDEWTSRPGEVHPIHGEYEPKFMIPPPLPGYVFNHLEATKHDVEWISGVNEVMMGQGGGGITSASAINALREAAQTKIRKKVRNRNIGMKQMGNKILSRIQQFYTIPRQIRISGDAHLNFATLEARELNGIFDIIIEAGSAMPVSADAKFQQATTMLELGIIDKEAFLEMAQIPNRDKIVARMREKEQQGQQQQAAQSQQEQQMQGAQQQQSDQAAQDQQMMKQTHDVNMELVRGGQAPAQTPPQMPLAGEPPPPPDLPPQLVEMMKADMQAGKL